MKKNHDSRLVKKMLKEQLFWLGRIFARHDVPDDVIWEVVKGFDLIYQKICVQAVRRVEEGMTSPHVNKMEPHPGLTYLLEKIGK